MKSAIGGPTVPWLPVILGLCTLVLVGIGSWGVWALGPVDPSREAPVLIRVSAGSTVSQVIDELAAKELIRSAFWMKVAARTTRATVREGLYHVTASEAPLALLLAFSAGLVDEVQVTIPEGWRAEEMARRLVASGVLVDPDGFAAALVNPAVATEFRTKYGLADSQSLEGFLFPDTYRFAQESPAEAVIEKLLATFETRTAGLAVQPETVILASLVEREAKFAEDRAPIARVYLNRLARGMRLEADPTVQFGKANGLFADCLLSSGTAASATCQDLDWWPQVTRADYQGVDAPSNTYRIAGLPPEPIANPGLASIEAVLSPATHGDLYFVTDAAGHAHFAATLDGHNANQRRYLNQ
ncbi:endolytic transglycosylase MltG [Candidatus Berkelbacteria bacterium]|nr:endolytic transglycosylase MltG [Candidatus Berkelbacteria bacterium]